MAEHENRQPNISVCISSYNYRDYILKALDVIAAQNADFEIVISDDCSSDGSPEAIREWAAAHPDVDLRLYVNEANEGITSNKSHLIEHARGKYILFSDSDDCLTEDALESLWAVAEKTDADCVVAYVEDVDPEGKQIQVQDFSDTPSKWMVSLLHGSLYKKSIIDEFGIHFHEMPEDAIFNLEFHAHSKNVQFLRKIVYKWLVNTNSEARSKRRVTAESNIDRFAGNCRTYAPYLEQFKDSPGVLTGTERDEIVLELMKIYYGEVLMANLRVAPHERIATYKRQRELMAAVAPDYLVNPNLKTKNGSVARPYAIKIVKYCSLLERMHVMPFVLRVYYFMRRFVFFDQ